MNRDSISSRFGVQETAAGRRAVTLLLVVLVAGIASLPVIAQEDEPSEFSPLNYAFATYVEGGIYSLNGRVIWIVPIKSGVGFRSEDEHPFGVRLRINATLGFFDFKTEDLIEFNFPDRVGTLTLNPGVGFPIKVGKAWELEPLLDFGAGGGTEGGPITPILGTGAVSRAEFPTRRSKVILFNRLIYGRDFATSVTSADDFLVFETTPEYRLPIAWVRSHGVDFGVFLSNEWYLGKLVVARAEAGEVTLRVKWEAGFTFGTVDELKFWKINVPRVGLSYRWGDLGDGIRFVFTFRY